MVSSPRFPDQIIIIIITKCEILWNVNPSLIICNWRWCAKYHGLTLRSTKVQYNKEKSFKCVICHLLETTSEQVTSKRTNYMVWGIPLKFKTIVTQLVAKFLALHDTLFIRACHWTRTWDTRINTTPLYSVSLSAIAILPFHLRLRIPNNVFLWDVLIKNFICVTPPLERTFRPFHPPWFDGPDSSICLFIDKYKLWSSSLCNCLRSFTSYFLGPDVPHPRFVIILSLCSYLNVKDQASIRKNIQRH